MTAAITTYTSYAVVRAILGVDEYDLPDTVLALDHYAAALERELRLTVPTVHEVGGAGSLLSRFTTISDIDEGGRTAEQAFYLSQIRLFAGQVVARECLTGLSGFMKRTESDGKASGSRFSSEATFRDIAARVIDSCSRTLFLLMNNDVSILEAAVPTLLSVVSPATDIIAESVRDELT